MRIISTGYTTLTGGDSPTVDLILCEGDCDSDDECAHGLVCFQRSGNEDDVPGCTRKGSLVDSKGSNSDDVLVKDWDYCIRAQDHPDWPCTQDDLSVAVCQDVSSIFFKCSYIVAISFLPFFDPPS